MVARSFKKKSWRKRCIAFLILPAITAILLLASGCSQSRGLCDEDGNMWRFTLGEVYKTSEIYVKDGDAYSPLLSYGLYLKGNSGERDATRFVWLAGNKLETLIPDIGDERQLVLFSHDANPEKSYKIEHFTDAGYTLGTIFKTNSLGQISFSKDAEDYSAGSTMYQAKRAAITNPAASSVRELNGMDFPYDNICSDGYMTGLESMGTYRIGFYEGTRFKQIKVQADTHISSSGFPIIYRPGYIISTEWGFLLTAMVFWGICPRNKERLRIRPFPPKKAKRPLHQSLILLVPAIPLRTSRKWRLI